MVSWEGKEKIQLAVSLMMYTHSAISSTLSFIEKALVGGILFSTWWSCIIIPSINRLSTEHWKAGSAMLNLHLIVIF